MSVQYEDPMDEIMAEAEQNSGQEGGKARWMNHNQKQARYILSGADEDSPMAERKKVRAVILYCPADTGRGFWPDNKLISGKLPLCQSERSVAPFDKAFVGKDVDAVKKRVMEQLGWTGHCSNCGVGTDYCKVRLVAYILDLDHVKQVFENNKDDSNEPMEHGFTKLDAKGPQSTWNFHKCYKELFKQARAEGLTLADYIVEFYSEEGKDSTTKVAFKVVDKLPEASPIRQLAKVLAREALEASKTVRKSRQALPSTSAQVALPPASGGGFDVIDDVNEVPW